MTKAQQAELERVARALRHELTQQDRDWDCCLSNEQASVGIIVKALAAQRATVLEEVQAAYLRWLDTRIPQAGYDQPRIRFEDWLQDQIKEIPS